MKEKMTQTTSRQKVIIVVMIIVVLIIIWQIVGLVGGSSPPPAPAIEPAKMDTSKPGEKEMKNTPTQAAAAPSTNGAQKPASGPQVDESLRQASLVNDPQFTRMQRITEEKYVGKLNELEELRIQRQIAETNQAIAAAKLATVTAEKDISDLLTKPSSGSAAFSSQMVKTSVDVTSPSLNPTAPIEVSAAAATPNIVPAPPQEVAPYKLMSVSMLFGKWTAVVSLQDTMFSVGVGDVLPPDNSVVTSISKNNITLRKAGKSRKVSITASF